MKYMIAVGVFVLFAVGCYGQEGTALDPSLSTCAEFMNATNHYKAASQVITEYDSSGKSVPRVKSVENPEKMREFIEWYLKGGRDQLLMSGEMCRMQTLQKSGKEAAYRAAWWIEEEKNMETGAVLDKLLKSGTLCH